MRTLSYVKPIRVGGHVYGSKYRWSNDINLSNKVEYLNLGLDLIKLESYYILQTMGMGKFIVSDTT